MGLRFKKSIKIAPGVKLNLNKNSTSVTFGARGAHYTVNSKGKKTASIGIPGTGISYVQSTKSSTHSQQPKKQPISSQYSAPNHNGDDEKWYQKTGWIIALLILFFPAGLFLMWKYSNWKKTVKCTITALILICAVIGVTTPSKLKQITLSADTTAAYDINQDIVISITTDPYDYEVSEKDFKITGGKIKSDGNSFIFSSSQAGSYKVYAEHNGIKSNELTLKVEDKAAIAAKEAEDKRIAEEKATQGAAAQAESQEQVPADSQVVSQENDDPIVYITNTGEKYHRDGCRFLDQSKIEKHLSEVKGNHEPCGVCNPPQ